MSEIIWYLFVSGWLIFTSLIHYFHTCCSKSKVSFLFLAKEYSIVYICHIFFIHSSVDGHLNSFPNLSVFDTAAINIGVHMAFKSACLYPLYKSLVVKLLAHSLVLFLISSETSVLFSRVAAPRRPNNYKYLWSQHRSTQIYKSINHNHNHIY